MREAKSKIWMIIFTSVITLSLGLVCDGLSTKAEAKRNHLVVQTWGGTLGEALQIAYFTPFTEETGIKVVQVEAGADMGGKLGAMYRANNIEWDMATGSYENHMKRYYDKGFLGDIDYTIVKDTDGMLPGTIKPWGVGQHLEGLCLVYNTKAFPDPAKAPKTWADFFNVEKFPGPRAMHNWGAPSDNLAIAMLAAGLSKDDLFPLDWDKALGMMDKVKENVKVWYTSGNQLVQALQDEEVVMAVSTDGRARQAIKNGAPVQVSWSQSFYFLTWWCVTKDAPMREAAMRLINFTCRPDRQAVFTKHMGYSATNAKMIDYLPDELKKQQTTHPDNIGKVFNMMEVKNAREWMLPNMADIEERWNTWIAR